jgi:hypothetical protein
MLATVFPFFLTRPEDENHEFLHRSETSSPEMRKDYVLLILRGRIWNTLFGRKMLTNELLIVSTHSLTDFIGPERGSSALCIVMKGSQCFIGVFSFHWNAWKKQLDQFTCTPTRGGFSLLLHVTRRTIPVNRWICINSEETSKLGCHEKRPDPICVTCKSCGPGCVVAPSKTLPFQLMIEPKLVQRFRALVVSESSAGFGFNHFHVRPGRCESNL